MDHDLKLGQMGMAPQFRMELFGLSLPQQMQKKNNDAV